MSRSAVAPKNPPLRLPDVLDPRAADDLTPGEVYELTRFAAPTAAVLDLSSVTFDECELVGWELDEIRLHESTLAQTRVTQMFATEFAAPRAVFRRSEFDRVRIGATQLMDTKIRGLAARESRMGFANLRGANLADACFTDCVFDVFDLADATASRLAFPGSRIGELHLARATLSHVDLRGAQVDRITGLDGSNGITITRTQAMELAEFFAAHLGVQVSDR